MAAVSSLSPTMEAGIPQSNEEAENGAISSSSAISQANIASSPVGDAIKQPSFPLLMLPFELQTMVFTEAMNEATSKPGIQWFNARIVWTHPAKRTWSISFTPLPRSRDDSTYRYSSDLASICDAATEAARCIGRGGQRFPVGARKYPMELKRDLLCLKTPGLYAFPAGTDTPNTPHTGIYWHPSSQPRWRTLDYDAVQGAMRGFEKVCLAYRDSSGDASAPFLCNSFDYHREDHMTRRQSDLCHRELAGFIGCCPDIKEFFLVLGVRMAPGRRPGRRLQRWEKDRIEHPVASLATFHEKQLTYHEIHENWLGPTTYGHAAAPCACPAAPGCHEPPEVDSDDAFELLRRTRMCLLDNTLTSWKLSLQNRQAVRFKVLVQGLPTTGRWASDTVAA